MNMTALIVTWNRLHQLKQTLKATLALPFQHIVIVNNGATDGTAHWLASVTDPRVHVYHADRNRGGAEGFYLGAKYISEQIDTDWVVFYDDDAWPAENFFEQFEKLATNDSAIICAKVIDCQGRVCQMNLPWRKRTITIRDNLSYMRSPDKFVVDPVQAGPAISCSFVGSIVKAEVLKDTYSLILRELFIYFDDVYYGYQLHLQDYRLTYQPQLVMYHDIGNRSPEGMAPWKSYYLVRNMLLSRHIFPDNSFFTWPAILFRVAKYTLNACRQPNRGRSVRVIVKAIADGIMDRRAPLDH